MIRFPFWFVKKKFSRAFLKTKKLTDFPQAIGRYKAKTFFNAVAVDVRHHKMMSIGKVDNFAFQIAPSLFLEHDKRRDFHGCFSTSCALPAG